MMLYNNNREELEFENKVLFSPAKKKGQKARMWREIEELKARQQLSKELHEIDQSFAFSLTDLV